MMKIRILDRCEFCDDETCAPLESIPQGCPPEKPGINWG